MRYIIDVTQLVHWPGNLTGIPRVMDELAIRFLKNNSNESIFVSWVKETGEMCEVDFGTTRTHRGSGIDYISSQAEISTQKKTDQPSSANQNKITVRRIVKKIAKKTGFHSSVLYRKIARTAHQIQAHQYKIYIPKDDDVFFIPWGEWWDQNWLNKVALYHTAGVSLVPVCHDILPMVVPQFSGNSSSLADFARQIFPLSSVIITPSQATKNDLTKWMKTESLAVPKIEVVAWGEDFSHAEVKISEKDITKKYDIIKDNYLVYVSTIEPRKNHTLLYYAYKLAYSKGITLPKILIIGRVGHDTSEIIKFIKEDSQVNTHIKICDYVGDDELNWLYSNCMFTIMPSFYEGLGMSVAESISRGKSAVCSNNSSLAEISDEFVIHFNPASSDDCLNAIIEMMKPSTLARYRKNIKEHYTPHTWDNAYTQVLSRIKEI